MLNEFDQQWVLKSKNLQLSMVRQNDDKIGLISLATTILAEDSRSVMKMSGCQTKTFPESKRFVYNRWVIFSFVVIRFDSSFWLVESESNIEVMHLCLLSDDIGLFILFEWTSFWSMSKFQESMNEWFYLTIKTKLENEKTVNSQ